MAKFRPAGSEKETSDDFYIDGDEDDYSEDDAPGPPIGSVHHSGLNKNQIGSSHGRQTEFSLGECEKPKSKTTRADMLRKVPVSHNTKSTMDKKTSNAKEEKVILADDFRAAVVSNNVAVIEEFLSAGFSVNMVFSTTWTPLMYAVYHGHAQLVKYFVDRDADVNFSSDMSTVLMILCSSSSKNEDQLVQCLTTLLERRARVDDIDRLHMTALMHASQKGHAQIVKKLLESGASMDLKDSKGRTALMIATVNGHLHVVHKLLEGGADVNVKNNAGSTALDMATMQGQTHVYELLKRWTSASQAGDTAAAISVDDLNKLDEQKKAADRAEAESLTSMPMGEMEMILRSLDLAKLIPIFREHRISFSDFLRFTDADLQAVGVTQLGIRKKILDHLRETHKKEWQTSSLMSVQYNKKISLAEAIAMVSNLRQHAIYMGSTVGFVHDQMKDDVTILTSNPQENATPKELQIKIDETIINLRNLYHELVCLRQFANEKASLPECSPPDLIVYDPLAGRRRTLRRLLFLSAGLGVLTGTVYWNVNLLSKYLSSLFASAGRLLQRQDV